MTAPDPRLDEIQALADGLTDLCPEHLRQSIRHVQRNCDIDCNTHEDDYDACKKPDRYDGERMAAALANIPFLLDELRKARETLANLSDWAGRNKTGYYDEAQDDVVQIIRAAVAAAKGDERG